MINDNSKNDDNKNSDDSVGEIIGIDYRYTYTLRNDNNVYVFDNNKNLAKVKYSRTMKLALFWDYVSSFRSLFGVLCTLRWPKNVWHKTSKNM